MHNDYVGSEKLKDKEIKNKSPSSGVSSIKDVNVSSATSATSVTNATNKVAELFLCAEKLRASDVHLDPAQNKYVVRMRVDGVMREVLVVEKDMGARMVGRIKVLARLRSDISQYPQDGRIDGTVNIGVSIGGLGAAGSGTSIRVSTIPSLYGESVVLRMLPLEKKVDSLEMLGYNGEFVRACSGWANSPHGLAIISGPTGSGKTTALYAILNMVDASKKVVVSIEDPVERHINLVRQLQVNRERGFTYPIALRHVMRQDPDIIMIGEIRDAETATIAVHAALTGHLVIATLHADRAHAIPLRLSALGIAPHYMAHSLNLMASIRLVRKLCIGCKDSSPEILKEIEAKNSACNLCGGSRYFGRVGISEHIQATEAVKEKLAEKRKVADEDILFQRNLWVDANQKIEEKVTTCEEVERVLGKNNKSKENAEN